MDLIFTVVLNFAEDCSGYYGRGFDTARRETGPVVEVDDGYLAGGGYNAVTAIYLYVECFGGLVAYGLEIVEVETQLL